MAYSSLPFPSNTPLENLKVIAEDTTIYIAPDANGKTGSTALWTGLTLGNDSSGDGTLAKPFATLKKAWQKAQEYVITGNARLTIQFQKGIYGYTYTASDPTTNPFPENLFHPQGEQIIIQGDPDGIKQRYLYRVKDYTWDLSRWSYYGHTGTVNLWRGQHYGGDTAASYPSGSGNTAHGFTFEDEGGFACISNAAMGAENGYKDWLNGVGSGSGRGKYSTTDGYGHNWGRAHFNHGLSYEEAMAVWGVCKIENARTNQYDLQLQFKNANVDARVFTYPGNNKGVLQPGLATGLSYGGIDANYPEPQYSQPNGYYGPTLGIAPNGNTVTPAWETSSVTVFGNNGNTVNLSYPARESADVHITDDPHLFTTYPVVIRVATSGYSGTLNKPVPLVLDSAKIGGIRNLMFVNDDLNARTYSVTNRGTTLGPSNGLDSVTFLNLDTSASSNECLVLRNQSEARIRHLGMIGWGSNSGKFSVVVHTNSRLFIDRCIDVEDYTQQSYETAAAATAAYAELGRLNNTPALMISHGGGIDVSDGSVLNLSASQLNVANLPKETAHTQTTSWCQITSGYPVVCNKSAHAVFGPLHLVNMTQVPGTYRLTFNLPVLAGLTVFGGSTGAFYHPTVFHNTAGRGATYHMVGYKTTSSGRTPFMRVCRALSGGTYTTSAAHGWWGDGNVTWSGGLTPIYDETVSFVGVKLHSHSMDTDRAVRKFLEDGNTYDFFAYHDTADGLTAPSQRLSIGKNGIQLSVPGGVTYTGIRTGASWGVTYAFGDVTNTKSVSSAVDLYELNNNCYSSITAVNDSLIELNSNTTLFGKTYVGAYSTNSSKIKVHHFANLSVANATHSGILTEWNSEFEFYGDGENSIIIKHPVAFGIGTGAAPYANYGYGLNMRNGGSLYCWGPLVVVGMPLCTHGIVNEAGQYNGFFSSESVSGAGIDAELAKNSNGSQANNLPLTIQSGSVACLPISYYGILGCWDGGNAKEASAANGRIGSFGTLARVHGVGAVQHLWNTAQGQGSNAPRIMTRGSWGSGSAQQWLYNAPRGATMWFVSSETGWISSTSATSTTVNTAYKENVTIGSSVSNPTVSGQRALPFTNDPPGYSGPAFGFADSGGHDNILIFGR